MAGQKGVAKKKAKKQSTPPRVEADTEVLRLKSEKDTMTQRLCRVGSALILRMKKDWRLERGIPDNFDPVEIRGQILVEAIRELDKRKHDEGICSLEAKVACLEAQISQFVRKVGKLETKCRTYEEGLESILEREDVTYIKDKIISLQSLAVTYGHAFEEVKNENVSSDLPVGTVLPPKPTNKLPGTSYISNMDLMVRNFIIEQLNYDQISGSDWRFIAQQVGISCETMEQWIIMKVKNPAGLVLVNWIISEPSATVNQLYRYLNSPGMRKSLMCKVLSDYYEII